MRTTLEMINQYVMMNDLSDQITLLGSDGLSCRVEMDFSVDVFEMIDCLSKYSNNIINIRIKNKKAIITFRGRN